jgi:hypothetical protein
VHACIFLAGFSLTQLEGALIQGIGASLIATGLAGWIAFIYVMLSDRTAQRLEILTEFGFIDAFPARAVRIKEQYDLRLRNAHQHIDILGFGLNALREDYARQFPDWARRTRVRILLIDPEFPTKSFTYAQQRDREENNPPGSMQTDVRSFIRAAHELLERRDVQFAVRLYRTLPSVNILRVDDELFWGPYLVREQSRNSPTFLVRRGGILFDRLLGHFESIWNDGELSREVPEAWLKR